MAESSMSSTDITAKKSEETPSTGKKPVPLPRRKPCAASKSVNPDTNKDSVPNATPNVTENTVDNKNGNEKKDKSGKTRNKSASTSKIGQAQSFRWACDPEILKFIKMSPEHLGKLEQDLKSLATVKIGHKELVLEANKPNVDRNWRFRCQNQLKGYLRMYSAQKLLVYHLPSTETDETAVKVHVISRDSLGIKVSVIGLAKDVEKKMFELRERNRAQPQRRSVRVKVPMHLNPLHQARVTEKLKEEVLRATNIEILHSGPCMLNLHGVQQNIQQARQMVIKDMLSTTQKMIHCPHWTLKHMKAAISKARMQFPEMKVSDHTKPPQIVIEGHSTEVELVLVKLRRVLAEVESKFKNLSMDVEKQYHKCIIGKGGQMINQLRQKYEVSIFIPQSQSDSSTIEIEGTILNVEAAKKEIHSLVDNLTNKCVTIAMPIKTSDKSKITEALRNDVFEATHVKVTLGCSGSLTLYGDGQKINHAQRMIKEEIQRTISRDLEIPGWIFRHLATALTDLGALWPEVDMRVAETQITLSGHPSDVTPFESKIRDEVSKVCDSYTCEGVTVNKEYHRCVIGIKGKKIDELRKRYKVAVIIPVSSSDSEEILLEGKIEDVASAKKDILELVRSLENASKKEITVPEWLIKYVVGRNGSGLRQIGQQHPMVHIDVKDGAIALKGNVKEVDDLASKFTEKISELESNLKHVAIDIDSKLIPAVFGFRNEKLKDLRREFQVDMHFEMNPPQIHIEGKWNRVDDAQAHLSDVILKKKNFCILQVMIEETHYGKLIGKSGCNLSALKLEFSGVEDIRVPKKGSRDDKVLLIGQRTSVDLCFHQLQYMFDAVSAGYLDHVSNQRVRRPRGGYHVRRRRTPRTFHRSTSDLSTLSCTPTPSECGSSSTVETQNLFDFDDDEDENCVTDTSPFYHKSVVCHWHDGNDLLRKFVRDSPYYFEQLRETLREIGEAEFDEDEIIVNGKIPREVSESAWRNDCENGLVSFFKKFKFERLHIDRERAMHLNNEKSADVVIHWDHNCNDSVVIYGVKEAVTARVDHLKILQVWGRASAPVRETAVTSNMGNEFTEVFPECSYFHVPEPVNDCEEAIDAFTHEMNTNEIASTAAREGQIKKSFRLTAATIKFVMASVQNESCLSRVKVVSNDDLLVIEGNPKHLLEAETFINSVIADEVVIGKYGAYEFLTDNSSMMEFIAMKCRCSMLVDQIQGSEEDNIFSCVTDAKKKSLQIQSGSAYGSLFVTVEKGDITSEKVGMIVNTTNKSFSLSGPLSLSILRKGGSSIDQECRQQVGNIRQTGPGNLPCQGILHVAIPEKNEKMEDLIWNILCHADRSGISSITLPTIGAGGGGWTCSQVAQGMHDGISRFAKNYSNPTNLKCVKIMLYTTLSSGDCKEFYSKLSVKLPKKAEKKQPVKDGLISKLISFIWRSDKTDGKDDSQSETDSTDVDSLSANLTPSDVTTSKTTSGESAKVLFASSKGRNIDEAKTELDKFIALHLKEFTIVNSVICRLNESQVEKIKTIALDNRVKVVVDQRKDKYLIVIQGRVEYASAANDEIRKMVEALPKGLPESWAPMNGRKLMKVTLSKDSEEFLQVSSLFSNASGTNRFSLLSIERIQNPELYRHYQLKKEQMSSRISRGTVEQQLFHGTPSKTIEDICLHGFNRSYAGKNATAYGKGVYFSTLSWYSDSYSSCGAGIFSSLPRQMFLADVLTGEFCPGQASMVDAPVNPCTGKKFDSVVDKPHAPTMFVVFNDASAYPSYVITYS